MMSVAIYDSTVFKYYSTNFKGSIDNCKSSGMLEIEIINCNTKTYDGVIRLRYNEYKQFVTILEQAHANRLSTSKPQNPIYKFPVELDFLADGSSHSANIELKINEDANTATILFSNNVYEYELKGNLDELYEIVVVYMNNFLRNIIS